ncbi:dynein light chain Tctex-type protein 2B-like [Dreissena polymorpha]|uniref:Uncharacterized protein n=1 Tax=Dreissena polymorpha TaxID=45954 RepID=A0A9D4L171_DREPO|nr:dynein light chain Tctex-type protein 2B-like [Dreissena polymorpha]KAH3848591.1 hypothetical protein DPMN_090970 [Dreissena polymorpha]
MLKQRLDSVAGLPPTSAATSETDETEVMPFPGRLRKSIATGSMTLTRRHLKRMSIREPTYRIETNLQNKEPTYRMEPKRLFKHAPIERVIKETLERQLTGARYDPKKGALWAKTMSEDIKHQVKKLGYDRYKIVCVITLCQKSEQTAICSSRCQWDAKTDTYASFSFSNESLICNATVYGIYKE